MDNNSFILVLLALLVVMAVLMLFINSRHKKQMDRLEQLGEQREDRKAVIPVTAAADPEEGTQDQTVTEVTGLTEEKKDAESDGTSETEASAYNTGNSGKIYTKEELELLIKE